MEEIKLETNVDHYEVREGILGFAGYKHRKVRKRLIDPGLLLRINHPRYSVLIYHNPVVQDYHLPQDSVGVYFDQEKLYFGLADGASIVDRSLDNNSGYLSYLLISALPALSNPDWQRILKDKGEDFTNAHHVGASTVTWGAIAPMKDGFTLRTLFVAEPFEAGTFRLFTNKKSIELTNNSEGFVPTNYVSDSYEDHVPAAFDLYMATDGVFLDEHDLHDLVSMHRQKIPLEELTLFLEREVQPNRDDQTLLLISTP